MLLTLTFNSSHSNIYNLDYYLRYFICTLLYLLFFSSHLFHFTDFSFLFWQPFFLGLHIYNVWKYLVVQISLICLSKMLTCLSKPAIPLNYFSYSQMHACNFGYWYCNETKNYLWKIRDLYEIHSSHKGISWNTV